MKAVINARVLLALLTACSERADLTAGGTEAAQDTSLTESDIRSELNALRDDNNARLAAACGATDADVAQVDQPVSPQGQCYASFEVRYDNCEEQVFPGRPAQAHAAIACLDRYLRGLVACCGEGQEPCSEEKLEACDERAGDACARELAPFDAALEACDA